MLCINQADTEERNQQVQFMSEIYRNAHVIIWLGPSSDVATDAKIITALQKFAVLNEELPEDESGPDNERFNDDATLAAKEVGFERLGDLVWIILERLFDKEYFTRTWVLQEIRWALSVEVQYDKWILPPRTFVTMENMYCRLTMYAVENPASGFDPEEAPSEDSIIGFYHLAMLAVTIEPVTSANWPDELHAPDAHTVSRYANHSCTDPRDRIYALVSFFGSIQKYPVNYNLSTTQVFTDFAIHCINTYQELNILGYNCRASCYREPSDLPRTGYESSRAWTPGLPSWCPDWAGPYQLSRELTGSHRSTGPNRPSGPVYHAAADMPPQIYSMSREMLALQGITVCQITECSFSLWSYPEAADSDPMFQSMESTVRSLLPAVSPLDLCDKYIDNLLPAQTVVDPSSVDDEYLSGYQEGRDWRRALGRLWLAKHASDLWHETGEDYNIHFEESFGSLEEDAKEYVAEQISYEICSQKSGARVFATDDGRLGTGPDGILPGDVVCVVYGAQVPYVLRPCEDGRHHTFIGEAYVADLMNGEALTLGLSVQEFRLV